MRERELYSSELINFSSVYWFSSAQRQSKMKNAGSTRWIITRESLPVTIQYLLGKREKLGNITNS